MPRCSAITESGRPCRRQGKGRPPLCPSHEAVFENGAGDVIQEAVEALVDAPPIRKTIDRFNTIPDRFASFLDRMGAILERQSQRRASVGNTPPPEPPPPPPSGDPRSNARNYRCMACKVPLSPDWRCPLCHRQKRPAAAPTPPPPKEDPRIILGFAAGEALTVEKVKERRRALAKIFHPDASGSTETMKRVNAAADALLKEVGEQR